MKRDWVKPSCSLRPNASQLWNKSVPNHVEKLACLLVLNTLLPYHEWNPTSWKIHSLHKVKVKYCDRLSITLNRDNGNDLGRIYAWLPSIPWFGFRKVPNLNWINRYFQAFLFFIFFIKPNISCRLYHMLWKFSNLSYRRLINALP
jgi:hypothetical protein